MALKKIGQILLDLGLVDDEQLENMLDEQKAREGQLLGQIGLQLGYYSDKQLEDLQFTKVAHTNVKITCSNTEGATCTYKQYLMKTLSTFHSCLLFRRQPLSPRFPLLLQVQV